MNLKVFLEWFDIQYQSMVWDLGEVPLAVEDWYEADDDQDPTYH